MLQHIRNGWHRPVLRTNMSRHTHGRDMSLVVPSIHPHHIGYHRKLFIINLQHIAISQRGLYHRTVVIVLTQIDIEYLEDLFVLGHGLEKAIDGLSGGYLQRISSSNNYLSKSMITFMVVDLFWSIYL